MIFDAFNALVDPLSSGGYSSMNNRSMDIRKPKRCDTDWPQTDLIDRRRAPRQRDHTYLGHKRQREPINWGLVLMVAGAAFIVLASMLYKLTGPAI